ncbi:MAG TPA: polysaccharide deacetylase family protein [Solirubrobacterales bacterium]|nr:polysaccharide deacetylase family protein [Solirubrobacterales bacterium]
MSRSRGTTSHCARLFAIALAALLALPATGAAVVKRGTAGADALVGTPRSDSLFGLKGGDTLTGRRGGDRLAGGPGNDRIRARDGAVDRVNCGTGSRDVATVDADDRVAPNCEKVEAPAADQPAPQTSPPVAVAPRLDPPPEEGPGEEEPPSGEEPEFEFEERPLAMFPSGHGWTGVNGAFTDAGGPFIVNGDRSFRIGSLGTATTAVATSPPLDPVNLEHAHVTVHGQVSFSNRLQSVKVRLASGDIATDYAEVTVWLEDFDPIILGSSFEFQSLARGDFTVVGQVDWSQIDRAQLLVTDNGLGEVAFYAAGIYAVPDRAKATVSFAFDDGDASTYTRALKKLSSVRYPATAYVIADTIDDPGFLTMEQLVRLRDQHHWEIAPHSLSIDAHNLPNGLDDVEPPAALKAEMNDLRDWIYENGFSRASFAYPKGAASPEVRHYVKRDYCSGRVTARGPETHPARDRYIMRGWSINGLESNAADVQSTVDRAVANGTWAILSFHDIVGGTPGASTDFNDDEFEAVVDYVRTLQKEGKVRVRTVGDVVAPHCAD